MYYSLPVKERMQLMKHYKTAYPGMSYNEMVEHFNSKQYSEGGPIGDSDYNQKRADELGYKKDSTGHLPSVDYTTGEFLKSKKHPTVYKEVEWYNSNDPAAIEFRKKNNLDVSGEYMRYIPKPTIEMTPQMQQMAFTPTTQKEVGDWVKKHGSGRVEESMSPIDLLGPAEIKAAASMVKAGVKAAPKVAKEVAEYAISKSSKPLNKFALKTIDAVEGTVDLSKQIKGELLQGSKNRAAIKEGNDWLKSWIEHPATKAKIEKDVARTAGTYKKVYEPHLEKYKNNPSMTNSLNNHLNENIDYLNSLKTYAQEYNPRVSEYPLTKQLKDNLKQYIGKGKENIHSGNSGVSYTHGYKLNDRSYIENNLKGYERYGNWISRDSKIPYNNRVSTTIHEGTHDWVNDEMMRTLGLRNKALKNLDSDVKQNFLTWENYRKVGKDPGKAMDSVDNYKGYLMNPTEQHARIMELRKHYNLKPDDVVTNKMGTDIAFDILDNKTPVDPYFATMFGKNTGKKLAELFNNLWVAPPAVVGAAYLNKEK